jgi:hypothetical protein
MLKAQVVAVSNDEPRMLLKTIRAFTPPEVPGSLSVLTDLLTTAVDDPRCSWTTPQRMTSSEQAYPTARD